MASVSDAAARIARRQPRRPTKPFQEEKMSKTLFAAALAFVLSIGGFALSAQDITMEKDYSLVKLVAQSKTVNVSLTDKLTVSLPGNAKSATFGYVKNDGEFVSLVDAMAAVDVANDDNSAKVATLVLGKFKNNDVLQFGYGNDTTFEAVSPSLKVASDPGFNAAYNIDSFYQLDFSNDPFDGMIDILVMGEPLPASSVTMLIALAAAAALLLFYNRRTRARFSAQV